jgi:hypothetical protein
MGSLKPLTSNPVNTNGTFDHSSISRTPIAVLLKKSPEDISGLKQVIVAIRTIRANEESQNLFLCILSNGNNQDKQRLESLGNNFSRL